MFEQYANSFGSRTANNREQFELRSLSFFLILVQYIGATKFIVPMT